MERRKICDIEFSLKWQSEFALHRDRYYAENVDFWRDILPGNMSSKLPGLATGESYSESFSPGELIAPYSEQNIKQVNKASIDPAQLGEVTRLVHGRYYPQGIAWKPLATFPTNHLPLRVLADRENSIAVDTNHPLAKYSLEIQATMGGEIDKGAQRGGSLQHIGELITTNGPGMQVPLSGVTISDMYGYPFERDDSSDDTEFYDTPRMVSHLDATAQDHVRDFYDNILEPGAKILDFMSSWQSHLSDNLASCDVTGLGLNEQELQTNLSLKDYLLQDLNTNTNLPFGDESFDAVICTVSIEYLCRPREIMSEIARILRPGGTFAVTISERWFPGKQIAPWQNMHPFERQGLVVGYFLGEPNFQNIKTESLRGYPRPSQDKYSLQTSWSDSLYMVWAEKGA